MEKSFANLMRGDPAPPVPGRDGRQSQLHLRYRGGSLRRALLLRVQLHVGRLGEAVAANRYRFDDERMCFFGITVDPRDKDSGRVEQSLPSVRYFLDFDGSVAKTYGALPREATAGATVGVRQFWVVLDPTLRVLEIFPFKPGGADCAELFAYLDTLPPPHLHAGRALQAPVLVLPNVFEPAFCRSLIELHETGGGRDTGFMSEVAGKTVELLDPARKRRRDHIVEDETVILAVQQRIRRRIVPEIARLYFFNATRIERYLIGCYTVEDGGHFAAHRDNTTKGTAHRRFAISINLNDDFDGGEVSFPEYGPQGFKPPVGGAVVFSCSLMHAVSAVSRGRRYAFLPFLYDDAAAKIRAANNQFLDPSVGAYKGG